MTERDEALTRHARKFLSAAIRVLERDRVLPRPTFQPYIEVGRDYSGGSLAGLPEFKALEAEIQGAHSRFGESTPPMQRDFTGSYVFSFLEACVARCARHGELLSPSAESVDESLRDLDRTLTADQWEVACCREVSHLTTADGQPLELSGLMVVPLGGPAGDHSRRAHDVVDSVIPGARRAHRGEQLGGFDPPQSIVIARDQGVNPYDLGDLLSARIDRFLLITRLLHAGTCHSMYEIRGETSWVRRFNPDLVRFRGDGWLSSTRLLRRTTRLSPDDGSSVDELGKLLAPNEKVPAEMVATSFGIALHKFEVSYHAHAWHEQFVDLATAFEGTLSGMDRADVVLRLKTRAAALLATENDPAEAIFEDVGRLYDIRSSLVHSGAIRRKSFEKQIRAISTVREGRLELAYAIDRLRDLVRRGILARVCLASGPAPKWKIGEDTGVDASLSNDVIKQQWRSAWHATVASLGANEAADRARDAVDIMTSEDR